MRPLRRRCALDDPDPPGQGALSAHRTSRRGSWRTPTALTVFRGLTPFVSIQNHYHMLERQQEQEMLPYCQAFNVGMLPYFPLAGGF